MATAIGSAANYHHWVFTAIRRYIKTGATVLEIGAGHGGFTRLLSSVSAKVIATDIDHTMILNINAVMQTCQNVTAVEMDAIELEKLHEQIDAIVAINIIEHIRDDQSFLQTCFSVLNAGGRLIVFAPAFPALFSNIDTEAGHFRRYTKKNYKTTHRFSGRWAICPITIAKRKVTGHRPTQSQTIICCSH